MTEQNKNIGELEKHYTTTVKQSSIFFVGQIWGYLLGFVAHYLMAKYFGPEILGHYSLILSIVQTLSIFTTFGLDMGIVKYVSRFRVTNKPQYMYFVIKTALIYTFFFSFLGAISLIIFKQVIAAQIFNDDILSNLLIWGAITLVPFTLVKVLSALYRAFKTLKYSVIGTQILEKLIFALLLSLILILNVKTSKYVIYSLMITYFCVFGYLFLNIKKIRINLLKIFFNRESQETSYKGTKSELLKYSSTVIFIGLMDIVLENIDKLFIGIYATSSMVGIYSIAARVSFFTSFFLRASNSIFSPIISELFSVNKIDLLGKLYSSITKWIIVFTLPIVASIVIFSNTIIGFFGTAYFPAASSLVILSIGCFVGAAAGANGNLLNLTGHEKALLVNNILMVIINIILNVLLIPKLGITGAAIGTVAAIISVNILRQIQVKLYLGLFPFNKNYIHIIINLIIISITCIIFRNVFNTVPGVVIVTVLNLFLSGLISYLFRTELDNYIFDKIKSKFIS